MITKLVAAISGINDWVGKLGGILILVMMVIVVYEVVARYVFNRPTFWAWNINMMLLLAVVVACGGFSVLHNVNIRIDIVYVRFPPKLKALMDMITSSLLFLTCVIFLWYGAREFINSYVLQEKMTSGWAPILWPVKLVLPIGGLLLILQGIVEFVHDYSSFKSGKERVRERLVD